MKKKGERMKAKGLNGNKPKAAYEAGGNHQDR